MANFFSHREAVAAEVAHREAVAADGHDDPTAMACEYAALRASESLALAYDFVMPKVGGTVHFYFEHAFWDGEPITSLRLSGRGREPVEYRQWRFAGRTEMRSRPARVTRIPTYGRLIYVMPEYDPTDRLKDGMRVRLAPREPCANLHVYRRQAAENILGRIVDGVLPIPGTWGFDPLPSLGGGK